MAMNQRRWKLARAELSAAHRLAPTKEGPALFLSELDAMEGRSDLELQHLRATVSASPNNPDYHHKLARALVVRGNLLEAESELRRALSLKPDSVPLLLDLAGLLHDSRRDPGRALALLRQAAEIDPDNARVAIGLAQTLRKLGNKTEALQVLRDYLKRNPDDADAWSLAEDLSRKR